MHNQTIVKAGKPINYQSVCREDVQHRWIDKAIYRDYINKVAEFQKLLPSTFLSKKRMNFLDETKQIYKKEFGKKIKTS